MEHEEMMEPIRDTLEGISSMRIRGAGKIARAASMAIGNFADDWKGEDPEHFIDDLRKVSTSLLSTRPTAVSLRNAILLTLKGVEDLNDVDAIREIIRTRSAGFVEKAEQARESIAAFGSKRIQKGSTVMTHCNSMAALTTIDAAWKDGRIEMVYSTESRPWRQGHLTAGWLIEKGIPVTMIVDSAARHFMREMDAVVVGADTIASNGAVINKIGTSQIALFAHESRVPFMVCSETFKFSRETLFGSRVEIEDRGPKEVADPRVPEDFKGAQFRNPVFDVTPPEYVDAIVTEIGIVSPYMATEVIREMFGMEGTVRMGPGKDHFNWFDE